MQKITPCLWFDKNCEEAVNFYTKTFPNSSIGVIKRYPEGMTEEPMQGMGGKILTVVFELDGYSFMALDGGPTFKMNPSVSFLVNFDPSRDPTAPADLDTMWAKLSEGGTVRMPLQEYPFSKKYGWVEDRFGMNWQLILTDPAGDPRPSIVPAMLFTGAVAGKAEEALKYYASIFQHAKMGEVAKYPAGMEPEKEGSAMYADAMLEGQWFAAMDSANPGHHFEFNEGTSFSVECKDQAEVDYFWKTFTEGGGQESVCGWLKDKYGFSWQITPKRMMELMNDPDEEKSKRALSAMMQMKKLDVAALEAAAEGK